MMKWFKGLKEQNHAQKEAETSVKGLGEALNLTFCELKYVTILLTQGFSINKIFNIEKV